eukprot:scaffold50322_cov62-Phaeocystis_antarctica.AAC.8
MAEAAAAADTSVKRIFSVERIFKGESPTARRGGRRGQNVANEAGVGLASRHRGLARHVVQHVVIVGQKDLLHAERVLVNLVACCAHCGCRELAVAKGNHHQTLVGVAVLDRHDGLRHLDAGHLGHNRLACAVDPAVQRDGVHALLCVRADGLGDERGRQAGVGRHRH